MEITLNYPFGDEDGFDYEVEVHAEDYAEYAMDYVSGGKTPTEYRAIKKAIEELIDQFDLYDSLDDDGFREFLMEKHEERARDAYEDSTVDSTNVRGIYD